MTLKRFLTGIFISFAIFSVNSTIHAMQQSIYQPWAITPLYYAVQQGRLLEVNLIIKHDARDIDFQDQEGQTALYIAAAQGNLAITRVLIAAGANCEIARNDGRTPLHEAALRGDADIFYELLKAGAEWKRRDMHKLTPLKIAILSGHNTIVEMLHSFLAERFNQTPLHIAACIGDAFAAKNLIHDNKDGIECVDCFGHTALHLAAFHGRANVLRILLAAQANKYRERNDGRTALHLAVLSGQRKIAQLLIKAQVNCDAQDINGQTPLYLAISDDIAKILIEGGALVNIYDKNKQSPLHIVALKGCEEVALTLIEAGAEINNKDVFGQTPLHIAASKGCERLVLALIKAGAEINAKDFHGQTPLHRATYLGHAAVVRALLINKADEEILDNQNKKAFQIAQAARHTIPAYSPKIARYFARSRATSSYSNNPAKQRRRFEHRQILAEKKRAAANSETLATSVSSQDFSEDVISLALALSVEEEGLDVTSGAAAAALEHATVADALIVTQRYNGEPSNPEISSVTPETTLTNRISKAQRRKHTKRRMPNDSTAVSFDHQPLLTEAARAAASGQDNDAPLLTRLSDNSGPEELEASDSLQLASSLLENDSDVVVSPKLSTPTWKSSITQQAKDLAYQLAIILIAQYGGTMLSNN